MAHAHPTPPEVSIPRATCCSGGPRHDGLDRASAEAHATLLKALADPVRLQLIDQIRRSPNAEACVCDLTAVVDLSQPTVSHHLKVLTDAGLLTRERRGAWAWFAIVPERLAAARDVLS